MLNKVEAAWLLEQADAAPTPGKAITIDGATIGAITSAADGVDAGFVIPALVDAHDHARVARLSQVGSYDTPLEAWLPYLSLIPAVDPWLSSAVAFGRVARSGVGAVMAHYTRVQGLTDLPTEAKAVAKAARDVGIRLALAIHCRDLNPLVYNGHADLIAALSPSARETITRRFLKPPLAPHEQVEMVETVASAIEGDGITVQYGPAGVQWCSDAMLRLIAERSAATGRRVHLHLMETRYQRAWADQTFPNGIVRYLDRIGLLNERVSFAHCIYLRPEEMELIAERGATLVVNHSSNLIVGSGVPRVGEMLRRGCRVAMGLDGLAFDEDEDQLREMRLIYNGHKALGFDRRVSRGDMLRMATEAGRKVIDGSDGGGRLASGGAADLAVLDWKALSAELVEEDVSPLELLFAKGTKTHVRDLFVAGRAVMRNRVVLGVDLPGLEAELLAALRAAHGQVADVRGAIPELKRVLEEHYRTAYYAAAPEAEWWG